MARRWPAGVMSRAVTVAVVDSVTGTETRAPARVGGATRSDRTGATTAKWSANGFAWPVLSTSVPVSVWLPGGSGPTGSETVAPLIFGAAVAEPSSRTPATDASDSSAVSTIV